MSFIKYDVSKTNCDRKILVQNLCSCCIGREEERGGEGDNQFRFTELIQYEYAANHPLEKNGLIEWCSDSLIRLTLVPGNCN